MTVFHRLFNNFLQHFTSLSPGSASELEPVRVLVSWQLQQPLNWPGSPGSRQHWQPGPLARARTPAGIQDRQLYTQAPAHLDCGVLYENSSLPHRE